MWNLRSHWSFVFICLPRVCIWCEELFASLYCLLHILQIVVNCISVCCFDTYLELQCKICYHQVHHVIPNNGFLYIIASFGALNMTSRSVLLSAFCVFVSRTEKSFDHVIESNILVIYLCIILILQSCVKSSFLTQWKWFKRFVSPRGIWVSDIKMV
jgi:hypothetical protein